MFLDSKGRPQGNWEDERFRADAQGVSKYVIAGMRKVQNARPPAVFDGVTTTYCMIAGIAFSVGVLIHKLPAVERKRIREYLVHKLDQMLAEHAQD